MKSERISPFWVNGYQPFSAKGELVIITDAKGKSVQGFFRNVEFVLIDKKITARYTVYLILECEKIIMASAHTDCVYDAVDIRKTTYKNYRYDV